MAAAQKCKSRESKAQQSKRAWFRDAIHYLAVRSTNAPRPNTIALVKAAASEPGAHAADRDIVLDQGDFFLGRQESTATNRQIAITADELVGKDVAGECKTIEGRGATDTPLDPDTCA